MQLRIKLFLPETIIISSEAWNSRHCSRTICNVSKQEAIAHASESIQQISLAQLIIHSPSGFSGCKLFCLSLYGIWTSQKMSNRLRLSKAPEVLVRFRHLSSSGSSGDSWHTLLREEQMHSDMFLKCLLAWYNIFIFLYVESLILFEIDI